MNEYCFWSYNVLINDRKETRAMKNFGKKIDELTKPVSKLTKLALEVGTLIAVIKPVLESIS